MSTHRVCCCDTVVPCYGVVRQFLCSNGAIAQIAYAIDAQVFSFQQARQEVLFGQVNSQGSVVGVAGVAFHGSATFPQGEIDDAYGISSFNELSQQTTPVNVVVGGQFQTIGYRTRFVAQTYTGDRIAIGVGLQNASNINAINRPYPSGPFSWVFTQQAASLSGNVAVGQSCPVINQNGSAIVTYNATGGGNGYAGEYIDEVDGEQRVRVNLTAAYSPVVGWVQYLPSWTGPTNQICQPIPATTTTDVNASAIEAMQANDPLRTCRGCGG